MGSHVQAILPDEVHKAFKAKLAREGKSAQDFLSEAVVGYLAEEIAVTKDG